MPQPKIINKNSDNPLDRVTSQERLFVEAYLKLFDAGLAATAAGYAMSKDGSTIKKRPRVLEAISYLFEKTIRENDKYKEKIMSKDEMVERLSAMSRTDLSDFLKEGEEALPGGVKKKIYVGEIDLDKSKLTGKFWLIKGIKPTKEGLEVTFHDATKAMRQLAELRGYLAPTRIEQSNKQEYDFSKLDDKEFAQLRLLLSKAAIPNL